MAKETVYCSECDGTGKKRHPWGKSGIPQWWYCSECNGTGIVSTHPGYCLFLCLLSAVGVTAAALMYWHPWS